MVLAGQNPRSLRIQLTHLLLPVTSASYWT